MHGTWAAVNASLNASSACLLVLGYRFIRAKREGPHRTCMLLACGVSIAFLISYVCYHAQVGVTKFPGQGWVRPVYFTILISHTVLAVVIIPLIIRTLRLAAQRRLPEHRRLARVTLPVWLYVSVTGVVVYWMLYWLFPSAADACPMCKDALLSSGDPQALARIGKAYATSMIALLGVPALLIGGITSVVVRSARRNRRSSPRS
jgi:uncharacterized membrane protein YozB (DUF420 family)